MNGKNHSERRAGKTVRAVIIAALAAGFLCASLTAAAVSSYYGKAQFCLLDSICRGIIERQPETEQTILAVLKEHKDGSEVSEGAILLNYGYRQKDFMNAPQKYSLCFAGIGFASGVFLMLSAFAYWHRRETMRMRALTEYLERVNRGGEGLLFDVSKNDASKLGDEIYKTVTALFQARDEALAAKNNYAENLSNIAHQLKTPITAISLSAQMMKEQTSLEYAVQILKQLDRLTHLEEALLLLSRIDAGTLTMERTQTDVFTVLTMAADNLQELFTEADVGVDIPEMGETEIAADMDWTMEAMMNLLKNCMEHTLRGGMVHCSYEGNPLYAEIKIWDEGKGFAREDIIHIFDRFYRGKNAKEGGIGIGLPLAKAIIEMQNGIISAENIPAGGACFTIRFYCH